MKTLLKQYFQRCHLSTCEKAQTHGARKRPMWSARRQLIQLACRKSVKVARAVESEGIRRTYQMIRPAVLAAIE